jgi:hypothetical protein
VSADEEPKDFVPLSCRVAAAKAVVLQFTLIETLLERVPSACSVPPASFAPVIACPVFVKALPAAVAAKADDAAKEVKPIMVSIRDNFFMVL